MSTSLTWFISDSPKGSSVVDPRLVPSTGPRDRPDENESVGDEGKSVDGW